MLTLEVQNFIFSDVGEFCITNIYLSSLGPLAKTPDGKRQIVDTKASTIYAISLLQSPGVYARAWLCVWRCVVFLNGGFVVVFVVVCVHWVLVVCSQESFGARMQITSFR